MPTRPEKTDETEAGPTMLYRGVVTAVRTLIISAVAVSAISSVNTQLNSVAIDRHDVMIVSILQTVSRESRTTAQLEIYIKSLIDSVAQCRIDVDKLEGR